MQRPHAKGTPTIRTCSDRDSLPAERAVGPSTFDCGPIAMNTAPICTVHISKTLPETDRDERAVNVFKCSFITEGHRPGAGLSGFPEPAFSPPYPKRTFVFIGPCKCGCVPIVEKQAIKKPVEAGFFKLLGLLRGLTSGCWLDRLIGRSRFCFRMHICCGVLSYAIIDEVAPL